jgi:hypothetical protein
METAACTSVECRKDWRVVRSLTATRRANESNALSFYDWPAGDLIEGDRFESFGISTAIGGQSGTFQA